MTAAGLHTEMDLIIGGRVSWAFKNVFRLPKIPALRTLIAMVLLESLIAPPSFRYATEWLVVCHGDAKVLYSGDSDANRFIE